MEEDVRQDAAGHPSTTRVSVQAAAERLGTTVDAIRKRVQRDTIAHEKDPAGRVWILLDTDRTKHDETGHRQDVRSDDVVVVEVVRELREQVAYLRDQLDQEREARTEERWRHDTIIAQLSQANAALASRVPELEPPRDPGEALETRESPETAAEEPYGTSPQEAADSLQRRSERQGSWWRRFFGFE
jgi:hypothetical protein